MGGAQCWGKLSKMSQDEEIYCSSGNAIYSNIGISDDINKGCPMTSSDRVAILIKYYILIDVFKPVVTTLQTVQENLSKTLFRYVNPVICCCVVSFFAIRCHCTCVNTNDPFSGVDPHSQSVLCCAKRIIACALQGLDWLCGIWI
jgi:hypothetical protein